MYTSIVRSEYQHYGIAAEALAVTMCVCWGLSTQEATAAILWPVFAQGCNTLYVAISVYRVGLKTMTKQFRNRSGLAGLGLPYTFLIGVYTAMYRESLVLGSCEHLQKGDGWYAAAETYTKLAGLATAARGATTFLAMINKPLWSVYIAIVAGVYSLRC